MAKDDHNVGVALLGFSAFVLCVSLNSHLKKVTVDHTLYGF